MGLPHILATWTLPGVQELEAYFLGSVEAWTAWEEVIFLCDTNSLLLADANHVNSPVTYFELSARLVGTIVWKDLGFKFLDFRRLVRMFNTQMLHLHSHTYSSLGHIPYTRSWTNTGVIMYDTCHTDKVTV